MPYPTVARNRLGGLIRQGAPPEQVDAARRDLLAAVAEDHARQAASAPLTAAERSKLASIILDDRTAEAVARALLPAQRRLDARRGGERR
jgi:hypothetical protein